MVMPAPTRLGPDMPSLKFVVVLYGILCEEKLVLSPDLGIK